MTKVEEVAEGQAAYDGRTLIGMPRGERERYYERARLAIAAMRIPTASMRTAFWDADEPTDAGFIAGWAAAIDKALEGDE